jgi:anti-sigma B factor antagonist
VIWLRGEHDVATKVSIAVAIARAARRDATSVIVDLSGVTFMDASTVGAIVGGRNRLQGRAALEVRAPSPFALRILELCGLGGLIQHAPAAMHSSAPALASWVHVPVSTAGGVNPRSTRASARATPRRPSLHRVDSVAPDEEAAPIEVEHGAP